VFVHLKGGDVFLQWEETDHHIWLTGPAGYVFTGTYDFAEALRKGLRRARRKAQRSKAGAKVSSTGSRVSFAPCSRMGELPRRAAHPVTGTGAGGTSIVIPTCRTPGRSLTSTWRRAATTRPAPRTGTRAGRNRPRPGVPPTNPLRPDYANLEVPFGSDIETVRTSYKSLMLKYHPDKHAGDPDRQKIALEITKKVNESFERIRARHEGGARG